MITVESLARATGRTTESIERCLYDVKARGWAEYRVVVKDADALEAIGQVIAGADVMAELAQERPVATLVAAGRPMGPVEPLDVIRGL